MLPRIPLCSQRLRPCSSAACRRPSPQPAAVPTRGGLPTLAPLLRRVTPAVVNIAVITRAPMEDNPLFRDPFFRRFFNLPDRRAQRR